MWGLAKTNKFFFHCTCCNVAGGPPEEQQPLLGARGVVGRLTSVRVLTYILLVLTTIGVAGVVSWLIIGTGLHYIFGSSLYLVSHIKAGVMLFDLLC